MPHSERATLTQKTQKTRPKKGKPVEIPVPKREAFDKLLRRAEKSSATRRPSK